MKNEFLPYQGMEENMTDITISELNKLSDDDFLVHLRLFPFESQWTDKKAFAHAQYTLSLIQGNKYQMTGNINAFNS